MIDPITITTGIQVLLMVAKAASAGIDVTVRAQALFAKARSEGRDVSPEELDALQSETDTLRLRRRKALADAAKLGEGI